MEEELVAHCAEVTAACYSKVGQSWKAIHSPRMRLMMV